MTLADVRQQYPQYKDMSDAQLAQALHSKFYSDMPFDQFASKVGLQKQSPAPQQPSGPAPTPAEDEVQGMNSSAQILSEGAKRFWGGMKQAGADISDLYNTYINPKADATTGQGIMPTAGAEATAAENQRQAGVQQQFNQQYGPQGGAAMGTMSNIAAAGMNAIPAVATEGAVGPDTTYTGNAIRQAVMGTLQGLTAFSPTNDKARDMSLAGGAGATLGLLNPVAAFNASLNAIRGAIQRFGGRSEAAYQAAKGIMGWGTQEAADAGAEPTIAMRSGAPMARTFEAGSFNGQLQDRYANIRDYYLQRFKSVFGLPQQSAESPALDGAYQSTLASAEGTLKGMRRTASDAYSTGMNEAIRLAGAGGGGNPRLAQVEVPELRSVLNEIMGNQTEQLTERTDTSLAPIDKLRDIITKQGGRLTVQDIAAKLRAWSQLTMNSGNPSEIAIVSKARSALYNDIDAYTKQGGAADPALQQVLATRAGYKQAMDQVEALQQTAAYRFLGVKSPTDVSPDSLLQRFSTFSPAKQREVADYLRDNSPQLLQLMRRKAVQDAVNVASNRFGPASNSEMDVGGLITQLYDKDTGVLKHSGLWSPEEQTQMERFRQAAKVVLNVSPHEASGAGLIVGPAEVVPNIISRSPIFIARQLSRVMQLSHGADIFTDPTLYDELMKVRSTSGIGQTAARTALSNYIAKTYGVSGSGDTAQ